MFKINRDSPWPPESDLSTARKTLATMSRDMRQVPTYVDLADALDQVIMKLDAIEAKSPKRLADDILTHSRFSRRDDE